MTRPLLNIITPCTRTENLVALAESVVPGRELFDLRWHVVFDAETWPDRKFIEPAAYAAYQFSYWRDPNSKFGNTQRNFALECIADGWVYFLDDDNIIHPDFFKGMAAAIARHPQARACAFSQVKKNLARLAIPESMRIRKVDIAQVCIHRSMIGETRFALGIYESGGVFIQALHEASPEAWVFLNASLCYYNKLRW